MGNLAHRNLKNFLLRVYGNQSGRFGNKTCWRSQWPLHNRRIRLNLTGFLSILSTNIAAFARAVRGRNVDSSPPKSISELFLHWGKGDQKAVEALLPVVYNELRRLAHYQMRQQRPNHTLQTTALVHEVYMRIAEIKELKIENRAHFLGMAAQLMRWILVDYQKRRQAARRGGGFIRIALDDDMAAVAKGSDVDLLVLDEALTHLAELDAQQSQIVELRYFGGLSIEETANVLGISPATVKRHWTTAKIWLHDEITRAARHDA